MNSLKILLTQFTSPTNQEYNLAYDSIKNDTKEFLPKT